MIFNLISSDKASRTAFTVNYCLYSNLNNRILEIKSKMCFFSIKIHKPEFYTQIPR